MVGIVKPFQHLKMSPANCKGGEASPSRLCIVDEEDAQNQTAETSTAATGRGNKQIDMACATCDSDTLVANSNENTPVVVTSPVSVPVSYPTVKSAQNDEKTKQAKNPMSSNEEGHSLTEQVSAVKEFPATDVTPTPHRNGVIDNTPRGLPVITTNTAGVSLPCEQARSSADKTENETDNEIQISNCFSLALDLTTKVQVKAENNKTTPSNDQPLDLSMKSKYVATSPAILDLSVKKQPNPITTTVSTSKNAENRKRKISETKPEPSKPADYTKPTQFLSISPQENNAIPIPLKIPTSSTDSPKALAKSPVIVIKDDAKESVKSVTPDQRPSSNPVELLPSMIVQSSNASTSTPNPMKRCASLDATSTQMNGRPEQRKRARMSLDDSRFLTEKATAASSNKSTAVTSGSHRLKGSSGKVASPLREVQSHIPASVPSVLEKPFVVSRPSAPRTLADKPALYTSQSTAAQISTQCRTQIAYSSPHHPPPYAVAPALTPLTSKYNGTLMTTSKYPPANESMAKARTARSRSVQSNNIRAQMIAQAYQPDIDNLEPYIKAQQRAVDEKIQELEAIKRQLADASENNKNQSPTHNSTAYPRHPKQTRQHYNPPVHFSIPIPKPVISSTIHSGQTVISHRIPTPTMQTNQPHFPHHQQVPRPVIVQGAHFKQRALPPRWRALPTTYHERPAFVIRRPVPNGNTTITTNSMRHMTPPRMMNRPGYPCLRNSSSALPLAPGQVPVPRAYPHAVSGPRLQPIPTPRLPLAPTKTPVYRNGGLTVADAYRTQLNEPIVIEDDLAQQSNTHRSGFTPNSTHSLKIRRAHSYHPPLSKNQSQWPAPKQTQKTPGSNAPDSKTESCARCGGKAYFLCSGCRKIWYCNKNCQLQDWNTHSSICNG